MRAVVPVLIFLACPASADVIEANSRVDRVTLFAGAASVVRQVEVALPKGDTTLVVTGLPAEIQPETIRVRTPDGVTLISGRFSTERLPAATRRDSAEVAGAKAELERREAVLREKEAGVAAIRARAEAAKDKLSFLNGLGRNMALGGSVENVKSLADTVGEEALAARKAAIAAETEAAAADVALKPERDAVEEARQALAALGDTDGGSALTIEVTAGQASPARIEIETMEEGAWMPVYDFYLSRTPNPALRIDKGVVVQQTTGRDWLNVDLTLSTAQVGGVSEARMPWPQRRSIITKEEQVRRDAEEAARRAAAEQDGGQGGMAEPVMEPAIVESRSMRVGVDFRGTTVTYHFPRRVDLRSDSESARLTLGSFDAAPTVQAVAVPSHDENAYMEAEFRNDTGEVLLPGALTLYNEGALVGTSELPLVAAGDKVKVGFGPINGIRLTRKMPDRSSGQEGLISTSNREDEKVDMTVENLTGESWPIQLFDSVPYSEQDALVVTHHAEPSETEANVDGDKGILRWDFTLAPGEKKDIRLETTLTWPDGQVLE